MKMFILLNMTLNMIFLFMKHPMSMGAIIIMQTVIISMMTGMMYKSFWFSYILFLMYIGGMMVLFIYMTSLMPNMMFSLPMKSLLLMLLMLLMINLINNKSHIFNNEMMTMTTNKLLLMKMYTSPVNMTMILLVMYLLYTMITVFNITDSNKSPLRMTYN